MVAAAYSYVDVTGTIIPDTAATRLGVETEYKDAFGQDLNVAPSTPQGMLITAETLARDAVARNNADLANQINPNEAGGVFLDSIGALTAYRRNPQQYSVLPNCSLAGIAGTVIPAGSIAQDSLGNKAQSLSTITLDVDGNGISDFKSLAPGAIDIATNAFTQIVSDIPGWETVINPYATILGSTTQSDESFRFYRRNTLALQGNSLSEAIISGLYATPGVRSSTFRENKTSSTRVIDGVTMVPHSMYACVDGGSDVDVANVLDTKKDCGCDYNGLVTVNITDPFSGQIIPIQFDRPNLIPILIRITIKPGTSVADPVGTTKAAIFAYVNGLINNEPGFVVGAPVSPFELAGAVTNQTPTIYVQKVEVSYASVVNYVVEELPIQIFEKATLIDSSIIVIVN
jgi:uncharacterized phage protein gp47/JayE